MKRFFLSFSQNAIDLKLVRTFLKFRPFDTLWMPFSFSFSSFPHSLPYAFVYPYMCRYVFKQSLASTWLNSKVQFIAWQISNAILIRQQYRVLPKIQSDKISNKHQFIRLYFVCLYQFIEPLFPANGQNTYSLVIAFEHCQDMWFAFANGNGTWVVTKTHQKYGLKIVSIVLSSSFFFLFDFSTKNSQDNFHWQLNIN